MTGTKATKAVRPARRVGILVLGMHRSGTSALTRVLSLLGCDLPANLVPASPRNEAGYWESSTIYQFNDRLLDSAGTVWQDWQPFNEGWYRSPKAEQFKKEALVVLEQEFGNSSLFALKDPRICRIAPFWFDVFQAADIEPLVMLPVRNPLEVAGSLAKRDGFDLDLALIFWLRYVLDSERYSRGMRRFFVEYDDLLSNSQTVIERAQDALAIEWPRWSRRSAREISEFLDEKFRHHKHSFDSVASNKHISSWIRDTYEILNRWSRAGESEEDWETLEKIRSDLDDSVPVFADLLERGRAATVQVQSLTKQIEALQREIAASRERLAGAESAAAEAAKARAEWDVERARLMDECRALREESAASSGRVSEIETELAEVRGRLAQTESALTQRQHETEQTAAQLKDLRHELDLALQASDARRAEFDALQRSNEEALAEAKAEIDLLRSSEDAAREAAETARADAAAAREAAEAEAERLTRERQNAEAQLGRRFDEIATLTRLLRDAENKAQANAERAEAASRELKAKTAEQVAAQAQAEEQRRRQTSEEMARTLQRLMEAGTMRGLPAPLRLRRRMAILRKSGLFDADWYLSYYRDVAEAGMDPVYHFAMFGVHEGRAANPAMAELGGDLPRLAGA